MLTLNNAVCNRLQQSFHHLALFLQPEVVIPSKMDMLELYHVTKLQDFLSSS